MNILYVNSLEANNKELARQLAAAIAAIKLKDEALATCEPGDCSTGYVMPPSFDERKVEEALTIQPDDSALKAWLGEPAGWTHSCPVLLLDGVELWIDRCPHCGKPAPKGLK